MAYCKSISLYLVVIVLLLCRECAFARINFYTCGKGSFRDGESCSKCPAGTFQDNPVEGPCKPCPPGDFSGEAGSSSCRPCYEGTFSKGGASECSKCPKGTNASFRSQQCFSCPLNTRVGLEKCIPCNKEYGQFTLNRNAAKCIDCGRKAVRDFEKNVCRKCEKGSAVVGNSCVPCQNGLHLNRYGYCESCPPGFIGNKETGGTRCVPCPSGTARVRGDRFCKPCEKGHNSFVTGALTCVPDFTPCPPNFFRNKRGVCERCAIGERLNKEKMKCEKCGKNEYSLGGSTTTCKTCRPSSKEARFYCECPSAFIQLQDGTCKRCPPGQFIYPSETVGGKHCVPCSKGTFLPKKASECVSCPPDRVQPRRGQASCSKCPEGLVPGKFRDTCVERKPGCPPDHERVESTKVNGFVCNAIACPAGMFRQRVLNSSLPPGIKGPIFDCVFCDEKGDVFNLETQQCGVCSQYETSNGGLSSCTPCRKGESVYKLNEGCQCFNGREVVDDVCQKCKPGTFGRNGPRNEGCLPCPPGTFSRRPQATECPLCPVDTFSTGGASLCSKCPRGSVSTGEGAVQCVRVGSLREKK